MYEEDQQAVLSKYSALFNEAADETELSAFLGSPTRQAVSLARAYNAKERKLQINSTSRADDMYEDEDSDEIPAFMQVVEQLREDAQQRGLLSQQRESRSVWADTQASRADAQEISYSPAKRVVAEEAPAEEEKPSEPDYKPEITHVEQDDEELVFDNVPDFDKETEPQTKTKDSSIPDLDMEFGNEGYGRKRSRSGDDEAERKVVVPLAVLYALIAVPITVLLSCIILIPTFASLGISAACLYIGFKVTVGAFAGFSMFSDIMVVLGSGVIILALGLLFLWLFIWFIGGAIAGLINAVIKLGGKWCSKEVR
jgi:hypothetical protein